MGFLFGDSTVVRVQSRDIEAAKSAKEAKDAVSFQFFDREEQEFEDEHLVGKPKNYSPQYMINGQALTLEEVKREHAEDSILISNMEANQWDRVWKTSAGRFTRIPEDAEIL
jgi:hypothetical protein